MKYLLLLFCSLASAETLDYTSGALTGEITLSQDLAPNGTQTVTPQAFSFGGFAASDWQQYGGGINTVAQFTFTTADGAITGWNVDVYTGIGGGSSYGFTEALTSLAGDSFATATIYSDCGDGTPSQAAALCPQSTITSAPGTWTVKSIQAPEINPGAGITAFLILGFGLQVIRSRK